MKKLEEVVNKLKEELESLKSAGLEDTEEYENKIKNFNTFLELIDRKVKETIMSYKMQNLRFIESELEKFLRFNIPRIYREDGSIDPRAAMTTFVPIAEETDANITLCNEIEYVSKVKLLRYFNEDFNEWNLKIILNREWQTLVKKMHEEIIIDKRIAFLTFDNKIKDYILTFTAIN